MIEREREVNMHFYNWKENMLLKNQKKKKEETHRSWPIIQEVENREGISAYLIGDSPFTISQWLMVVIDVSNIQASAMTNFLNFIHDSIYPYKCVIITLHYIL